VQEKLPLQEQNKLYRTDQSLANIKVLIVDDDSRNTYSLYNAFEAESMNIIVASNGVEALKQLDEHPETQIILMDIMMPEMDGLECTKRIRSNLKLAGIPIIALTAKAMKEDKEKCLEAGASDYVTKPVNIEKLLSLMRVWVNRNENIIML
jgi:CheY-like chemotaxis protein